MRNMTNSPKTVASALAELSAIWKQRTGRPQDVPWVQDFGLFPEHEVRGAGLPEHMMTAPGLQARLRPEFDLPLVTATGPLGEVSVLPPQVEFSGFQLGPRFSGEPNGASRLDWSVSIPAD